MTELLSALLGALIATAGGFFTVKIISEAQTRNTIAATLAAGYMSRFSAPDMLETRDAVDLFLTGIRELPLEAKVERCAEVCRRDTAENVRLYNRLHALSMLFGEIGVGFQRGLIDAQGLAIFDRLIPYYWHELSPYIAAAHVEFGFPIDATKPLVDQKLTLFSKFGFAYKEMVQRDIAREANVLYSLQADANT